MTRKALLLIAFAAAASPAIAATSTPTPPVPPSPPAIALENAQKAVPPLRLREPLMIDDRRHQLTPPGRLPGSNKPMPKNGGGPEIG